MKKRIPLIRQHEPRDCGAAALSMILEYYGKKIPFAMVFEAIKVDRQGANLYGIHDGAIQFGLDATILEGTAQDFIKETCSNQIKLPVIARIINRYGMEHYIVVTKIKRNKVHYCDPGEGRKKLTLKHFSECFLGHVVTFQKSANFQKENRRKGSVMEFINLITRQKGLVATVGVLSVIVIGITMAGTFLFQYLIDTVIPGFALKTGHQQEGLYGLEMFALLVTGAFLLYVVRFVTQLLRGRILLTMSKQINLPLMLGYYNSAVDMKMEFFDNHQTGDLLTRFGDASKVQEALSSVTLTLMVDVPMILLCGATLFRQSADLFAIIAAILVLYVVISVLYIRPMDKRNRQLMVENSRLNSYLKESFDSIQTIKAFNAGTTVKARTKELFHNIQTYGIKASMLSMTKESLMELLASVGMLALLWMGSVNIQAGTMTLGTLMAFYTMFGYFLTPIRNLMELQGTLQAAVVAASRLRDIMDRTKENRDADGKHKSICDGDISVEGVSFRYGNRFLVLEELDMKIQKGQSVAIVGPSGCGKTTVTKLLMGFYTPEKGVIKIGGDTLERMDLHQLRQNIAYVSQEIHLFSDSIRSNLMLGSNDALTDEEINAVLNVAGCDFIDDMPFGLDTVLDEGGMNLSGGQRQRLAIARALLRKPQILILDEATSALDTLAERKLQKALKSILPEMTIIMVAHRLNSIRDCDHIIVMDKGVLIEEGTHSQLMERGGLYAEMYHSMN